MDWLSFAGSILGGLIGGIFTFFGVKLTLRHEDRKKLEERNKEIQANRPRMEINSVRVIEEFAEFEKEADLNVLFLEIKEKKTVIAT